MPLHHYGRIPRPDGLVCALWFRRPRGCRRESSSTDVSRYKNNPYGTQGLAVVLCLLDAQCGTPYSPCVLAGGEQLLIPLWGATVLFTDSHRQRALAARPACGHAEPIVCDCNGESDASCTGQTGGQTPGVDQHSGAGIMTVSSQAKAITK